MQLRMVVLIHCADRPQVRRLRVATLASLTLCLAGCNAVVLHPSGDIAAQQRDLLLQSAGLMLLIIVPVMALTAVFAWRYRQANRKARYEPEWAHSTQLELVIWGAPLLIIICLGALTWMGTHLLDPYRPIERTAAEEAKVPAADRSPLDVEVVALDWKWLFIYPQYGIAAVNEMAAPVDRPIAFKITASTVMNAFYIPALAGQVYAMPGMQTRLHAVIDKPGAYEGFSSNYSGAGFSGMRFVFHGFDQAGFDAWVAGIRQGGGVLDRARYLALERPSSDVAVRTFETVDSTLYDSIVNMCVRPGKMCESEMSAIDAKGGLGLAGIYNILPLEYDKFARRGTAFGPAATDVASLCALPPRAATATAPAQLVVTPVLGAPIVGAGLSRRHQLPFHLRWSEAIAGGKPSNS